MNDVAHRGICKLFGQSLDGIATPCCSNRLLARPDGLAGNGRLILDHGDAQRLEKGENAQSIERHVVLENPACSLNLVTVGSGSFGQKSKRVLNAQVCTIHHGGRNMVFVVIVAGHHCEGGFAELDETPVVVLNIVVNVGLGDFLWLSCAIGDGHLLDGSGGVLRLADSHDSQPRRNGNDQSQLPVQGLARGEIVGKTFEQIGSRSILDDSPADIGRGESHLGIGQCEQHFVALFACRRVGLQGGDVLQNGGLSGGTFFFFRLHKDLQLLRCIVNGRETNNGISTRQVFNRNGVSSTLSVELHILIAQLGVEFVSILCDGSARHLEILAQHSSDGCAPAVSSHLFGVGSLSFFSLHARNTGNLRIAVAHLISNRCLATEHLSGCHSRATALEEDHGSACILDIGIIAVHVGNHSTVNFNLIVACCSLCRQGCNVLHDSSKNSHLEALAGGQIRGVALESGSNLGSAGASEVEHTVAHVGHVLVGAAPADATLCHGIARAIHDGG